MLERINYNPSNNKNNIQNQYKNSGFNNDESVFSVMRTSNSNCENISKKSPLDITINSQGQPSTILSEKINSAGKNRPAMVQGICNKYNNLKSTLTVNKKYLPKIMGLCSTIETKTRRSYE